MVLRCYKCGSEDIETEVVQEQIRVPFPPDTRIPWITSTSYTCKACGFVGGICVQELPGDNTDYRI